MTETSGADRHRLAGILAALGAYMALAAWLRLRFPIDSLEAWYRSFLWMSGPRAAGFALLLYLDRRYWQAAPFALRGMPAPRALAHGAATLALWAVLLSEACGAAWPWERRLLGSAACVLVGAFEEYLFRGLLLGALLPRHGAPAATLAASVLFTLYHTRPQSLPAWPHIFLTGVLFSHFRLRGMSLGQLALLHAAVDAAFFFVGMEWRQAYGPRYWVFLGGLYAYAALTFPATARAAEVIPNSVARRNWG